VEAQQEKIGIKMLFRQGEMTALLKGCTTGLQQALDAFMVNLGSSLAVDWMALPQVNGVDMVSNITTMKDSAQRIHQEVLELISVLDDRSSDTGSIVCHPWISFLNHWWYSDRSEVCFPTPNTGL
jgi:hypothetical protein